MTTTTFVDAADVPPSIVMAAPQDVQPPSTVFLDTHAWNPDKLALRADRTERTANYEFRTTFVAPSLFHAAAQTATTSQLYAATRAALTATTATKTSATITLMRAAFAWCVALMTCGFLLTSFALATGAGAFVRGTAATLLWSGLAIIAVASHRAGQRSGEYLLGERWSLPITIFAVGMVVVALIAAIEFSLR